MSLRIVLLLCGSVFPTPHIEKMIFSSAIFVFRSVIVPLSFVP